MLVFYPRDFTFVCPTELRALAELHDEFAAAGAQIVAASSDSYWSHRAWFGSEPALRGVRYPVLAGELCPVDWRPGTPTLRLAA